MRKFAIIAVSVVSACWSTLPTQAQMSCNAYDISNALDSTKDMQDASQKDETMREVAMARRSMLSGDRSSCDAHMQRLDQLTRQR